MCRLKRPAVGKAVRGDMLDWCDSLLTQAGVKSRNEFVTEALRFYCGYLSSRQSENYLLRTLSSVLTSTVQDTENRLARIDFKIAVELSKLTHVIAYIHEVDPEDMKWLHGKCVEEVKRINGAVEFESAREYYQKKELSCNPRDLFPVPWYNTDRGNTPRNGGIACGN